MSYDNPDECQCCGNDVHTISFDTIANVACEINTICFGCGLQDLWGYGYSQSKSMGWNVEHRVVVRLNIMGFSL